MTTKKLESVGEIASRIAQDILNEWRRNNPGYDTPGEMLDKTKKVQSKEERELELTMGHEREFIEDHEKWLWRRGGGVS